MLHLLRRHPFPVQAFFRHSLVLTYAMPEASLAPLLCPGLTLDTYRGHGFLAIALVQTEGLRPAGMPAFLGRSFFLSGYRIFARHRLSTGETLRGLRILRSDTDRRAMTVLGNLFTHYAYRRARVDFSVSADRLAVSVATPGAEADLDVVADLAHKPAPLPPGSPFESLADARRFAGPLPFTFDYERETHALVVVKGVRSQWSPEPVAVQVSRNTFLASSPFAEAKPVLANAFHLSDVPYRWTRGRVEPVGDEAPKAAATGAPA
jgi:Uncharacterized conserved protein (COG2071)